MNSMKPIQTIYQGYKFRSRLEARWAYFFDLMGIEWEYEPQGFEIGHIRYLPDFKVTAPTGDVFWYEVKPASVTSDPKFDAFSSALKQEEGQYATLLNGDPMEFFDIDGEAGLKVCPRCGYIGEPSYSYSVKCGDELFHEHGCWPCDYSTPSEQLDWQDLFTEEGYTSKGAVGVDIFDAGALMLKVEDAARKVRVVRFEHGEVPA